MDIEKKKAELEEQKKAIETNAGRLQEEIVERQRLLVELNRNFLLIEGQLTIINEQYREMEEK